VTWLSRLEIENITLQFVSGSVNSYHQVYSTFPSCVIIVTSCFNCAIHMGHIFDFMIFDYNSDFRYTEKRKLSF